MSETQLKRWNELALHVWDLTPEEREEFHKLDSELRPVYGVIPKV